MSESGYLEDGGGSCEDQNGEGRRSGRNVSGDGEGEEREGGDAGEHGERVWVRWGKERR